MTFNAKEFIENSVKDILGIEDLTNRTFKSFGEDDDYFWLCAVAADLSDELGYYDQATVIEVFEKQKTIDDLIAIAEKIYQGIEAGKIYLEKDVPEDYDPLEEMSKGLPADKYDIPKKLLE